ncbi:MAG TPA: hypothetical protein VIV58_12435 [Kofleriaceae bacterium]
MGDPVPDSKTPALAAIGLAIVGIVIAAAMNGGITHGSILGGIIAAAGAIPACYGMWKGIQQETQGTLAVSVGAVLVALGVGGILIVLGIISMLRH